MKIRLLDLCCKAGGASMGYYLAAKEMGIDIEIVGVDIETQKNYPFTFIQADAVEFLQLYGLDYDIIHASPPCQMYTCSTKQFRNKGKVYRDCHELLVDMLYATGKKCVVENVPNSPVRPDVILRGDMFGLKVIRKRHFELVNWFTLSHALTKIKGGVKTGEYVCVYGNASWKRVGSKNKKITVVPEWRKETIRGSWSYAMGIDWYMTDIELANAIPPAYTKYVGGLLFEQLVRV